MIRNRLPIFLAAMGLLFTATTPVLAQAQDEGPSVTIYSSADPAGFDPQRFIAQQRQGYDPDYAWQVPGFGVVKETRKLSLNEGLNELRFTDVAQFIDPTTVSFTDMTSEGTAVLEQNFEFDLVSPEKLMEKYIDRKVVAGIPIGDSIRQVEGTLLSANQGRLVLQTAEGVRIVNSGNADIELGELPGGLITRPTLVWKVAADQGGEHAIRTTYQTDGITWRSDYNMILNPNDTKADIGAWVTLMNLSGAAYENAKLKLIAGDVQRIQEQNIFRGGRRAPMKAAMADMEAGFEEKSFFEYHLYTLPRRTDIKANATQQITLFPTARDVNIEKLLVYYGVPGSMHWRFVAEPMTDRNFGNQSNPKVDVYVRFANEEKNNMGMPLPKGKVRVYKRDDADGTLEFIGEDLIDHTPRDEKVLIKLGQAFDVVGERKQTDFDIDTGRRTMHDSYQIELRNHKDEPQKVVIKENMFRWTTWEITRHSDPFEKIDARTVHFEVMVPARGKKVVTYTVKYTW